MWWTKRISSILFAIAFICAVFYLYPIPSIFIYRSYFYWGFLFLGGGGLLVNFLSFQLNNKEHPAINFIFWLGALTLFGGLIFKIMHWPYQKMLIVSGIVFLFVSYFGKSIIRKSPDDNEPLDSSNF
jgi:hypothetical protein